MLRRRLLHRRAAETLAARRDAGQRAGAIAAHFHLGGHDDEAAAWSWRAATRSRELFAHEEALHQLDFTASLGRDDGEVALARGDVLVALARYEPARDAFSRALALSTSPSERAGIERRLADVAVRLGEWERAAAGLDAALALAGDDPVLRARLLADRAVVAARAGAIGDAREAVATALATAPAPDAYVHNAAGVVALAGGELAEAVARFEGALTVLRSASDPVLEAAVVNNLATAQAAGGAHHDAAATARTALELGGRLGDRHRLAALHANLADRLHELDDAPPGDGTPQAVGRPVRRGRHRPAGPARRVDADELVTGTPQVSSAGGRSPTTSGRWTQATSCHAPCFQPIRRYVPTGAKPSARCSPTLASLGSVIPATAVR